MGKRLKTQEELVCLIATAALPRPGDFPLGSAKSRAAARAILDSYRAATEADELYPLGELTELEEALIAGAETQQQKYWILALVREGVRRNEFFGFPIEEIEEAQEIIRHHRELMKAIDAMTGGRARQIMNSDPVEWKRLKEIIEKRRNEEDATKALDLPDPDANSPLSGHKIGKPGRRTDK